MRPRVAIMDMNNNHPNQGLRCIEEIVDSFADQVEWQTFDVRHKGELPDTSFDIYISSGGPGSPLEEGTWRAPYLKLIDKLVAWNMSHRKRNKYVFFICYSFQLACQHFNLAEVNLRRKTSFGIYPVHKTDAGKKDDLLKSLDDPYHVVDSRDWQVVQPRLAVFQKKGAKILSLEKIRTHVEYERAIMAVRFSYYMVGTQYHPEADPAGLKIHFTQEKNKDAVITNYGEEKYYKMMSQIDDPEKIIKTHQEILPNFMRNCIKHIQYKESHTLV